MANLRSAIVLVATLLLTAVVGCTESTPDTVASGRGAPVIGSSVLDKTVESSPAAAFDAAGAGGSPVPRAVLTYSADSEPTDSPDAAPDTAAQSEPADASDHYRKRVSVFADAAGSAAWLLERHASTDSFDQVCSQLKYLLERIRSADEDDGFDATTQKANLVLQRLRLGRTLLRQRDDLDDMQSPGAVKLLRNTYQACGRLAQDIQPEIADLRREVDVK